MSFASLKSKSQTNFKKLAETMSQERKGGFKKDQRFWEPEIDKSGSGFAVIRFLPAIEGEKKPFVKIFSHGFKHMNKWFIEDCPTTIGLRCPVCEANSDLVNSGTRTRFISNIIVVSNPKKPEDEGKVFLYKYPGSIFKKIMYAFKPEFDDEVSFNPFDFWGGAPFKLKIRFVDGFRNYDKSEFGDCGPLFEDDNALENLWKTQYSLQEFMAPGKFKPYEKIKERFDSIIRLTTAAPTTPRTGENEPEPSFKTPRPKPAQSQKTKAEDPRVGDDDDFALFSSLID